MRHEIHLTDMLPETRHGFGLSKQNCMTGWMANRCAKSKTEYLMAGDIDRSFGVWVNAVGQQKIEPDMTYPSKEHPDGYYFTVKNGRILNEYQLVYITDGTGDFYHY